MEVGFLLYIDEAGDEGVEKVRPIDSDGGSEYFVLSGVIMRTQNHADISREWRDLKIKLGRKASDAIHFRDMNDDDKIKIIAKISELPIGIVTVISNKRNMRGYRNRRCENKNYLYHRGRKRPVNINWFYNNMFRYLFETATEECARITHNIYGKHLPIKVTFSKRRGFSYSQTGAYLQSLSTKRAPPHYFNSKRQINWSVYKPGLIEAKRDHEDECLQIADCVASAIYRDVDEDQFRSSSSCYTRIILKKILKKSGDPRGYGFILLPAHFSAPFSATQREIFRLGGYIL